MQKHHALFIKAIWGPSDCDRDATISTFSAYTNKEPVAHSTICSQIKSLVTNNSLQGGAPMPVHDAAAGKSDHLVLKLEKIMSRPYR